MERTILSCLLVAAGAAAGYGVAISRAPASGPRVPSSALSAPRAIEPVVRTEAPSMADLRRAVREELTAAPTMNAPAAAPAATPRSAADAARVDEAHRRIDRAIAQRAWTREDAQVLGRGLAVASPDERAAMIRTLIPALNRGELRLTYRGELF